jgi:alpha-beta hydrolase superfamily lysophospholipase
MVHNETFFETGDGTKLFLYRWTPSPDTKVSAVLHIVHGMAEHALRYKQLAEKLTEAGIEVWAADQRGHGKTANPEINKPGRGGLLGHCADKNSYTHVTSDIHALNIEIKKNRAVPLFLLGHSWGSFIVQNYIEEYSTETDINGCILSGTMGPGNFKVKASIPFLSAFAFFHGKRKGSTFVKAMADGSYNNPFKPNRTPFDWISRDTNVVDKYIEDPHCGFLCSTGFYRDLTKLLFRIHQNKAMAKINRLLPVYVFSGSADPVGNMGAGPTDLVNVYRCLGINDLEIVLYPGARHELLNETNREEVIESLLSWLKKRFEPVVNEV